MIDFRYHLVSIVAVLLALAIGIVLGSGFLGRPLIRQIRKDVRALEEDNQNLERRLTEERGATEQLGAFTQEAELWITSGKLQGEEAVIFEFEGTDRGVGNAVEQAIERAGGEMVSKIVLTNAFALESPDQSDLLADIVGSSASEPASIRRDAASVIGGQAAASSAQPQENPTAGEFPARRFDELLGQLQEAGFVEQAEGDVGHSVPPFTQFVVIGGSEASPAYPLADFATTLATDLAGRGATVVAGETSDSAWGMVAGIRDDEITQDVVSTNDQVDTIPGHVAVVLVLDRSELGEVGHYGIHPGASRVIPDLTPGS